MTSLHERTATELSRQLRSGELSPTDVTEHYLDRVIEHDGALGAFVTVTPEAARARAAELTAAGPPSVPTSRPLWGLPVGDKDLSDRAGVPTGFGSRAFAGTYRYVPEVSSDVTQVLDAAGVVSLGKTAAPELGFPSYTETLVGPPARNPWDLTRGAGGSSGGAAVAVAAGLLPVAPGSDGGGSIRIPAAACGLVGLKPTRGLLPAGGGVESLGGLVVHGPLARTTADAALLLEGMLPRTVDGLVDHPRTLRTGAAPAGSYLAAAETGETPQGRPLRLGVSTFSSWEGAYDIVLSPEGRAALDAGTAALAALGHELVDADPWEPDPTYAPAFRTLWMAGAAAVPVDDPERFALLEPLTRWLVERGRAVTARELVEALGALSAFERTMVARVSAYDAVLLPAMAQTPRPLGWYDAEDPERNFAQQCQYTPYTSMINVCGLPAITVPTHWTTPDETAPAGLPMGVQLVGRPGGERTLLALAAQLEEHLRWPDRHPPAW
jgi:amidase